MKLLLLITLCCVFSTEVRGYVYGNGVVRNVKGNTPDPYVFIGHNLSLWCNLTLLDVESDSRLLYFIKGNNELIPMEYITIVTTKTIQLNYPVLSINDEGNYVCRLNSSTRGQVVVGNQFVKVEYLTRAPRNVHCRVDNWENMTCFWDLGIVYNDMKDIEVHLIWAIMDGQFDCPHMSSAKTSCSWKKHDGNDSFKSQQPYHMVVLVTNRRDPLKIEKKTKTYRINTALIVKPAPVENLHISYENISCARLSWHHSSFYDKYYEISYSSQWGDKMVSITTEEENILICNLTPYTMYTFRVRCKPQMEGYWSEEVEFLNRTPEYVPAGAPLLKPGSFAEYPCSVKECREVVIYWQPMQARQKNGEIVQYVMNITEINSKGENERQYSQHIRKDRNTVKLTLSSLNNYQMKLSAQTERGLSKNFSSLYITSHIQDLPVPKQFVVEAEEIEVTNMHFSWREPVVTDETLLIDSYTLYYCQGSVLRKECDGELHWINIPAHQYKYKIEDFPRSYDAYMFGISVNVLRKDEKVMSSGLWWSDCTYKTDAVPEGPPENVQVFIVEEEIIISWKPYECVKSRGHVINFLIRYCMLNSDNICSNEQLVRTDGDAVKYILKDLMLEETYYITVSPFTNIGEGPSSSPVYISIPFTGQPQEIKQTTVEPQIFHYEDDKSIIKVGTRKETVVGLIVAGLVFLVFASVGLYYICRKFFKFKKKCDVPNVDFGNLPELPKGDSFQDQTDNCYRNKFSGYAEIDSSLSTFLPGYSFAPNQKRNLYRGDKPREYTSSTRSLLHISDDNSEMSEQNKRNSNVSQAKDSGVSSGFTACSETDHDYEDIDEVVSKAEEIRRSVKQKKKKADLVTPVMKNDLQLIVKNPHLGSNEIPQFNTSKHSLPVINDKPVNSGYIDNGTIEGIINNKLAGANTRFRSADCVAETANSNESSNVSEVPAYSRFGSCGKLVGSNNSSNSHYMPQNIIGPRHVSPTPYGFRNLIDGNEKEKSSYLIQSLHDQLTLPRPDRRITDLVPAPSGQYYTLEQVNESSSSSSSPQSSASSAELENKSAQHRTQLSDNSGGNSSGTGSVSNSDGSAQTEVYIPTREVIRQLPKDFFRDRVPQSHMPTTDL